MAAEFTAGMAYLQSPVQRGGTALFQGFARADCDARSRNWRHRPPDVL